MISWCKQLSVVFLVFMTLGFLAAYAVFWNAPRFWSGVFLVVLATGLAGGSAWAVICGREPRPGWLRTILAGLIAGLALHPIYLLLLSLESGELLGWSEFITGSLFFLLVGGIITVPAGVVAAITCRLIGMWCCQPSDPLAEKPKGHLQLMNEEAE